MWKLLPIIMVPLPAYARNVGNEFTWETVLALAIVAIPIFFWLREQGKQSAERGRQYAKEAEYKKQRKALMHRPVLSQQHMPGINGQIPSLVKKRLSGGERFGTAVYVHPANTDEVAGQGWLAVTDKRVFYTNGTGQLNSYSMEDMTILDVYPGNIPSIEINTPHGADLFNCFDGLEAAKVFAAKVNAYLQLSGAPHANN